MAAQRSNAFVVNLEFIRILARDFSSVLQHPLIHYQERNTPYNTILHGASKIDALLVAVLMTSLPH